MESMENFFAETLPELVDALVICYGAALDLLDGQHVYAASLAHADGEAWRPDLNTEENLATTVTEMPAEFAVYYEDDGDSLRWWPDEWTLLNDSRIESALNPIFDVCEKIWTWRKDTELETEEDIDRFYELLDQLMADGMSDPRVYAVFASHGHDPVLTFNNTDGDNSPNAANFDRMNVNHADDELLKSAKKFWTSWA